MHVFGLPRVTRILDKDKTKEIPSSGSQKARNLNFELSKALEIMSKSEYLFVS